ncbi:unnamed protein product [Vitrella brassicaformis CCMP3155]|uniref:Uncharacterized protein n=1 Tax=Vitrella brassicaformis (strain CCMP3155) TaxID=1169540 RepID=A0A0G4FU42_VITBC|nr:unnamed protein product [Vitrella brassicaformis CCMP3155]|eukprot:CEM18483.1 unnamed protein product [Vitrella brassicaformis CCMP3155]
MTLVIFSCGLIFGIALALLMASLRCYDEYNAARAELESVRSKLKAAITQLQMAASCERFERSMEEILPKMEQAKCGPRQPGRTSEGGKDSRRDAGGGGGDAPPAVGADESDGEEDAVDGGGSLSLPPLNAVVALGLLVVLVGMNALIEQLCQSNRHGTDAYMLSHISGSSGLTIDQRISLHGWLVRPIYRSSRDGTSYADMLRCVGDNTSRIVFIIWKDQYVFGCYISGGLRLPDDHNGVKMQWCDVWYFSLAGHFARPTMIDLRGRGWQFVEVAGRGGL